MTLPEPCLKVNETEKLQGKLLPQSVPNKCLSILDCLFGKQELRLSFILYVHWIILASSTL
jgi:hypothetical protein